MCLCATPCGSNDTETRMHRLPGVSRVPWATTHVSAALSCIVPRPHQCLRERDYSTRLCVGGKNAFVGIEGTMHVSAFVPGMVKQRLRERAYSAHA